MDGLSREAGSPVPHYLCTPACADCCALIVAASSTTTRPTRAD